MPIANFPSAWMGEEHRALEDAARRFFTERWVPQAAQWRAAGRLPREAPGAVVGAGDAPAQGVIVDHHAGRAGDGLHQLSGLGMAERQGLGLIPEIADGGGAPLQ